MLDRNRVKKFWDDRAKKYDSLAFESVANLEEDSDNLKLKIQLETTKVFKWMGNIADKTILDIGAGVGQWSFRFIEHGVHSVTAVEFSEPLAEIGRKEAKKLNTNNIKFVVTPAEKYTPIMKFDIVFISGLFVYLDESQTQELMLNIQQAVHSKTVIVLRDGTAVNKRYEINNKMSEHLKSNYSAIYRSRSEYIDLFEKIGLELVADENMFDEGCQLNKYPETRLRLYLFKAGDNSAQN